MKGKRNNKVTGKLKKNGEPRKPREKKKTTYGEDIEKLIKEIEESEKRNYILDKWTYYNQINRAALNAHVDARMLPNNTRKELMDTTDLFVVGLLVDAKNIAAYNRKIFVEDRDLLLALKLKEQESMIDSHKFSNLAMYNIEDLVSAKLNRKKLPKKRVNEKVHENDLEYQRIERKARK